MPYSGDLSYTPKKVWDSFKQRDPRPGEWQYYGVSNNLLGQPEESSKMGALIDAVYREKDLDPTDRSYQPFLSESFKRHNKWGAPPDQIVAAMRLDLYNAGAGKQQAVAPDPSREPWQDHDGAWHYPEPSVPIERDHDGAVIDTPPSTTTTTTQPAPPKNWKDYSVETDWLGSAINKKSEASDRMTRLAFDELGISPEQDPDLFKLVFARADEIIHSGGGSADQVMADLRRTAQRNTKLITSSGVASARGSVSGGEPTDLDKLWVQVADAENPYVTDPYTQRGSLVNALTGRAELGQANQRYNVNNTLIDKGFFGSGIAQGVNQNLNTQQDIQDEQRNIQLEGKRREWSAMGKNWETDQLQRLSLIDKLRGTTDLDERNRILQQSKIYTDNKFADQTLKLKKDQAVVKSWDDVASYVPG